MSQMQELWWVREVIILHFLLQKVYSFLCFKSLQFLKKTNPKIKVASIIINIIHRKRGKPTCNCHLTRRLLSYTWNLTSWFYNPPLSQLSLSSRKTHCSLSPEGLKISILLFGDLRVDTWRMGSLKKVHLFQGALAAVKTFHVKG